MPRALREAFSSRHREIAHAAERFRAKHGRAPERGEIRDLALENRRAKELTTRGDLQRVWRRRGSVTGSAPMRRCIWSVRPSAAVPGRPVEDRIEAKLTERKAIVRPGLLRAVALEQTAGELEP